MEQQKLAVA
jgi:WD repeat-containing protein 19